MSNAAIEKLGKLLMSRVRDEAISQWSMIVAGRMKADESETESLQKLGPEGQSLFLSLMPRVVDSVLHHLLWTLEQSDEVTVAVKVDGQEVSDINEVSDGLAGELYGEQGWIARFSKN